MSIESLEDPDKAVRVPTAISNAVPWRRKLFLLVNVWLAFHLFAIVICPASAEPSSPLVRSAFGLVSPYLHALYLDHAFQFFVPEPGPSTLVEYTLQLPDGSSRTDRIPSRSTFPRLLYHRYFMLSEFLGNGPEELMPLVERAFARNLCRETGATRVTLVRIVHDTPSEADVLKGMNLNDASLFTATPLGLFTVEELQEPFDLPQINLEMEEDSELRSHDRKRDSP